MIFMNHSIELYANDGKVLMKNKCFLKWIKWNWTLTLVWRCIETRQTFDIALSKKKITSFGPHKYTFVKSKHINLAVNRYKFSLCTLLQRYKFTSIFPLPWPFDVFCSTRAFLFLSGFSFTVHSLPTSFLFLSISICFAKRKSTNQIENALLHTKNNVPKNRRSSLRYQMYWFIIYFQMKWRNEIQIVCQIFLFSP